MKPLIRLISVALLFCVIAPRVFGQRAQIHIDLRHPGPRVSPTLYGLFFEEINHAGDGGLNAEMVRNGSFEETDKLDAWRGPKKLDTSVPLNAKNMTALRIVDVEGKGAADVTSEGYW